MKLSEAAGSIVIEEQLRGTIQQKVNILFKAKHVPGLENGITGILS